MGLPIPEAGSLQLGRGMIKSSLQWNQGGRGVAPEDATGPMAGVSRITFFAGGRHGTPGSMGGSPHVIAFDFANFDPGGERCLLPEERESPCRLETGNGCPLGSFHRPQARWSPPRSGLGDNGNSANGRPVFRCECKILEIFVNI